MRLRAEPDNQALGRRLKGAFKQVSQEIKGIISEHCIRGYCLVNILHAPFCFFLFVVSVHAADDFTGLSDEQIQDFQEKGELMVAGHVLSGTDLKVSGFLALTSCGWVGGE